MIDIYYLYNRWSRIIWGLGDIMYRQSWVEMIPPCSAQTRMMNIFIFMKLQNLSVENLSKYVYSEFVSSDLLVPRLNTKCFLLSQSLMVFESSGWLHSFGPQFLLIIASKQQSYTMKMTKLNTYLSIWLNSQQSYKAKYRAQLLQLPHSWELWSGTGGRIPAGFGPDWLQLMLTQILSTPDSSSRRNNKLVEKPRRGRRLTEERYLDFCAAHKLGGYKKGNLCSN